jgi:hypothetical protein
MAHSVELSVKEEVMLERGEVLDGIMGYGRAQQ